MRVFLTGATGLLGGNLVEALSAQGMEVSALVRAVSSPLCHPSASQIVGDLRDVDSFEPKLADCEVLIHAGACYSEHYRSDASGLPDEVNVGGTRALLKAAANRRIRNIIYISSSAVLSDSERDEVDESSPYPTFVEDLYFRSKIEAEKVVRLFAEEHPEIRIVLLLPSVMLGPGDRGPTPTGAFVKKVMEGKIRQLLPGYHRIVDVRDTAKAVCASLDRGKSKERYLIGGRRYEIAEIQRAVSSVVGRSVPRKRINPAALLFLSKLASLVGKAAGRPPFLKPQMVKRLQKTFCYNSEKAERELGVRFRPIDETIRDTVQWFSSASEVTP